MQYASDLDGCGFVCILFVHFGAWWIDLRDCDGCSKSGVRLECEVLLVESFSNRNGTTLYLLDPE